MIDLRTELGDKWQEARHASHGGHEWRGVALAVQAPIRFLAGIREPDDRPSLLLEAPLALAPSAIFRLQSEGLTVADQRRPEEGIFRLAITLESDELGDVFEVLAADVVDVAVLTATAPLAISAATRRLLAWQACLKARRLGLSREEQLGLAGELIVLQFLAAEIGYLDAVDAWEGPLDGLHDFGRFGVAIEVKAILGIGNLFRISRLDQLESKGLSTLVIARPKFREDVRGRSLSQQVSGVRNEIASSSPTALSTFNERLLRVGYLDLDARLYDGQSLLMYELHGFEVTDGFPRLLMSNIPAGIVDGTYVIDERSISAFRLDADRLRGVMRSMNGSAQ